MSQRNPMNERYTQDEHQGKTRKSAASAKPATKAASTVTIKSNKKDPKQIKAEEKAARKAAAEKQREIDRKYYKPDTLRYKQLRRLWWFFLGSAVIVTVISFLLAGSIPTELSMALIFVAYALIIAAFYVDFSKIKKERLAYQARMVAEEEKQAKAERQAALQERASKNKKKSSGGGNKQAAKKLEAAKRATGMTGDAKDASADAAEDAAAGGESAAEKETAGNKA